MWRRGEGRRAAVSARGGSRPHPSTCAAQRPAQQRAREWTEGRSAAVHARSYSALGVGRHWRGSGDKGEGLTADHCDPCVCVCVCVSWFTVAFQPASDAACVCVCVCVPLRLPTRHAARTHPSLPRLLSSAFALEMYRAQRSGLRPSACLGPPRPTDAGLPPARPARGMAFGIGNQTRGGKSDNKETKRKRKTIRSNERAAAGWKRPRRCVKRRAVEAGAVPRPLARAAFSTPA